VASRSTPVNREPQLAIAAYGAQGTRPTADAIAADSIRHSARPVHLAGVASGTRSGGSGGGWSRAPGPGGGWLRVDEAASDAATDVDDPGRRVAAGPDDRGARAGGQFGAVRAGREQIQYDREIALAV